MAPVAGDWWLEAQACPMRFSLERFFPHSYREYMIPRDKIKMKLLLRFAYLPKSVKLLLYLFYTDEKTGKTYFAAFGKTMPDLNYQSQKLVEAIKDVFEYSYRKYFGMRLLNGLALINESTELEILKAFKTHCGVIYINKCETMYNDIQKSRKFVIEHLDAINNNNKASSLVSHTVNYTINILTFSIWDIKRVDTIEHALLFSNNTLFHYEFYHLDIYNYINEYIMFYKQANLNTVIYHSLYHGTVELYVCDLNGNKVSLCLSPVQAFVCLMFHKNKSRVVMISHIMKCFYINDRERVNDIVVPMVNAGIVVFNEMKNGIGFGLDGSVGKGKKINVKVNVDGYKDKEMLEEGVVHAQRKVIVDSYVMKIMKAKQKCSHNVLVAELIEALNNQFVPDAVMLKNRIEGLIEREYLERQGNTYIYKR